MLGMLAGIAAGVTTASLAGARRTQSCSGRLRRVTAAADAIVFPGQVGPVSTRLTEAGTAVRDADRALEDRLRTFAGQNDEAIVFIPTDRRWLAETDRPLVVAGRMFDRNSSDEFAPRPRLRVRSQVTFHSYGPDQDDKVGDPPTGATVHLHVVGVIKEANERGAVVMAADLRPGLVLMDINMPATPCQVRRSSRSHALGGVPLAARIAQAHEATRPRPPSPREWFSLRGSIAGTSACP